ncbi:MAG: HAD-IA family hydrolase [Velocimicrobium sp.]
MSLGVFFDKKFLLEKLNVTEEEKDYLNLLNHVTPKTPQVFVWGSNQDPIIHPSDIWGLASNLRENNVLYELHIFGPGSYGQGISDAVVLEILLEKTDKKYTDEEKAELAERKNTMLILKRLGLGRFFDAISDGNTIKKSRPDPEVFQKAARSLDLSPSVCLVVEDAKAGIQAGVAGGFDTAEIGEAMYYEKTMYPLTDFSQILNVVIND